MTPDQIVLWAGLFIGLAFGVCGQVTGFCLTRGLKTWWGEGDGRKIRAFALAVGIAMLGSQILHIFGLVDLDRSLYAQPSVSLPTLVLGGALFGYGMVMANGCGSRSIILLGQGNLRSLVVLLCLGIGAAATLTGLLAPIRLWLQDLFVWTPEAAPLAGNLLPALGIAFPVPRWLVLAVVAGGLSAFAFWSPAFRSDWRALAGGIGIGLLIPAGWYATGVLGYDDFDPVALESLTFVAPVSNTIQYAMLATGIRPSFGVTVVAGVFLGALAAAILTRQSRLEGFSRPRAMLRYVGGGTLMGIGGALALGCSIGQGITGLSTLAIGSFLAAAGILVGAALAIRGPLRLPEPQP